jgi:hypothetical protein
MLRKVSAVLLGVLVAFATVMVLEWLGHQVYPVPPDVDFNDPQQMRQYVATLPLGAFASILLGWMLGTITGGLAACYVAREKPVVFASIIGAIMLAATITNLVLIPHPTWFSIAGIIVIGLGTLLAIRWSTTRSRPIRAL